MKIQKKNFQTNARLNTLVIYVVEIHLINHHRINAKVDFVNVDCDGL
jgi:hypothetical protein